MNAAQYNIVKFIVSLPMIDISKFAKMINIDSSEALRVYATNNFEQYQRNDTPTEDLMGMFGSVFGGNPFGGPR